MEFLLNRYRNLTVLLVVILAQLVLIAYQVKTSNEVPLIRVWTVTAVTPVERALEFVRRNTIGVVEDYFALVGTKWENDRLKKELGSLKIENQYLRTELNTADRAKALSVFQAHSQSKMLAARIIGNGTGANSKVVFVDRGSAAGVESGMAVVTPDGIVGKVVAAYPTASSVLLITDANFAAGVISQKNRVRGALKGLGHDGSVQVDYIQNEEKVEPGEWFFTSGDDRIFPKGSPVGKVAAVRNGRNTKEVFVSPSGFQGGLEEVLIVTQGVHQAIPEEEIATPGYHLLPPPVENASNSANGSKGPGTDADRLNAEYKQLGDRQKHVYGEGTVGSTPPDFTKLQDSRNPANPAAAKPSPKPGEVADAAATANKATSPGTPVAPPDGSNRVPAQVVSNQPPVTPPKPKPSGPLLVTDPNDADPSEAQAPALRRPAASNSDLNEFGEPRSKTKPVSSTSSTEILPPAAPPKPKKVPANNPPSVPPKPAIARPAPAPTNP